MSRPPFTKEELEHTIELCRKMQQKKGGIFNYCVIGSRFKHTLIQIAKNTQWTNPHEEVRELLGLEIITCKGITGNEVFFYETQEDALELRDAINNKIKEGLTWADIMFTLKKRQRYDKGQFEQGETIQMEDFSNVKA